MTYVSRAHLVIYLQFLRCFVPSLFPEVGGSGWPHGTMAAPWQLWRSRCHESATHQSHNFPPPRRVMRPHFCVYSRCYFYLCFFPRELKVIVPDKPLPWDPFLNWLIWFLSFTFFHPLYKKWLFFFSSRTWDNGNPLVQKLPFLNCDFFSSHFLQYIKANFLSTNLIWKQSCEFCF